jgi:hypothetical protein
MSHPSHTIPSESLQPGSSAQRPWVVYGLGAAFVVLLFVCYIKADLALGWLESVVRAAFLH